MRNDSYRDRAVKEWLSDSNIGVMATIMFDNHGITYQGADWAYYIHPGTKDEYIHIVEPKW